MPFLFTIANESTELSIVDGFVQETQIFFVEFERCRMLLHNLPDDFKKLCENRCHFPAITNYVATTICELMSKSEPIFFNHHLEAFDGAVVWFQQQRRYSYQKTTEWNKDSLGGNQDLQQVCAVRSQPSEQWIMTLMPIRIAFATNRLVSRIDLTWRNHPLPSIPDKKLDIEGTLSSHAEREERLKMKTDDLVVTIYQLLQTSPHHMNVFDAKKVKLGVFIKQFIFIAFPLSFVDHGVYFRSCINNIKNIWIDIGLTNAIEQSFIIFTSSVETGQRLCTPRNRCLSNSITEWTNQFKTKCLTLFL